MNWAYKTIALVALLLQVGCSNEAEKQVELNVPDTLVGVGPLAGLPFHQAVPLEQGALFLDLGQSIGLEAKELSGYGSAATLWPDGSVQWLSVHGVVSAEELPEVISARWGATTEANSPSTSAFYQVEAEGQAIRIRAVNGFSSLRLQPVAEMVGVNQPVHRQGKDPEYNDTRGQYLWAGRIDELHTDPQRVSLEMKITEAMPAVTKTGRTLYTFKGVGSHPSVKGHLEWQLLVEVDAHSPVVRTEVTWGAFWDESKWALAGASWQIETESKWSSLKNAELVETLNEGWSSSSDPSGVVQSSGDSQLGIDADYLVLQNAERSLGLALPTFSKLGPNRLEVMPQQIIVHCWDPQSGYALDLRQSSPDMEFNTHSSDLASRGIGVSRTIELSLIPGTSADAVTELSRAIAMRDNQWLPSANAIIRTGVLGPIQREALEQESDYFDALLANLHFLLRSQERWRWYGFINYGDVRTNFAIGENEDRGLYPLRWSLYGRYGWRNGSGDVPNGLLRTGLILEDRELTLMALDYARHLVDVDMVNRSHAGEPLANTGGMHRRNRDHWSGSVQMQYSPSNGLYLASWISDSHRMQQGLDALRDYASQASGGNSALAAQAWINYYRETHDPEALEKARELLDQVATWWSERPEVEKEGLAALYQGNFRWQSDGVRTLLSFYEATQDTQYLDAISEIVTAEMQRDGHNLNMGLQTEAVLGYLAGLGVQDVASAEYLEAARANISQYTAVEAPDKSDWEYDRLVEFLVEEAPGARSPVYRESNAIGSRAFNSLYALNLLVLPAEGETK